MCVCVCVCPPARVRAPPALDSRALARSLGSDAPARSEVSPLVKQLAGRRMPTALAADAARIATNNSLAQFGTFYMYEHPALDHSWLRHCPGFAELRHSVNDTNTAEAGVHKLLRRHPWRRYDPAEASLFYVPVFEYASYSIGACNGTTHQSRMVAAEAALRASPHFQKNGGADHVWATTAWSISGSRTLSLTGRMAPLSSPLSCSIVGRYKYFPPHGPSASAGGACTFEIPYQANIASSRFYRPPDHADAPRRTTLLQFSGALDVCCTGRGIRCAIAPLYAAAMSGELSDVIVRPIVPSSLAGKPCTARALKLAALAIQNRSQGAGGRGGTAATMGRRLAYVWRWSVNNSDVELMAREMATTVFCLSPAGDNCVSARFFSAVAAGCLPVVICDHLAGTFHKMIDYESFWIKYKQSDFTRNPLGIVDYLRAMPASEVLRRQRAMDRYRADILYDTPPYRMGTHILLSAAYCWRKRMTDSKVERCRQQSMHTDARKSVSGGNGGGGGGGGAMSKHLAGEGRHAIGGGGHSRAASAVATTGDINAAITTSPTPSTSVELKHGVNVAGNRETCECATRSLSAACDFGNLCPIDSIETNTPKPHRGVNVATSAANGKEPPGHLRRHDHANTTDLRARIASLDGQLKAALQQLGLLKARAAAARAGP